MSYVFNLRFFECSLEILVHVLVIWTERKLSSLILRSSGRKVVGKSTRDGHCYQGGKEGILGVQEGRWWARGTGISIREWGREEYQEVRKEGGGQEGRALVSGSGEGRNIRRSGRKVVGKRDGH